jgi:ABC-type uncharacterized transport system permease subunit
MSHARLAALVILVTLTLGTLAYVAGVHTYGTPGQTLNGGITADTCGVEVWGTPGPFCSAG